MRYLIQAKRKHEDNWSEWNTAEAYPKAIEHVEHPKRLGYDGRLVPSTAVTKLWEILGEDQTELTDKILDAGFCLRDVTVYFYLCDLKRKIHNKAVYPDNEEESAYVNLEVFDTVLKDFLKRIRDGERNEQVSQ